MLPWLQKSIQNSQGPLYEKSVASCMFGLRSFNSDHPEVLSLIAELRKKLATYTMPMRSSRVSTMVSGLRGLSTDETEVRLLVKEVTRIIQTCAVQVSLRTIDMALAISGFRRLDCKYEETRQLIRALLPLIAKPNGWLTPKQRVCIADDLKGLDRSYEETQLLLEAIDNHK
jgi:hypothetical protein